jgi:hypothetical protein
MPIKRVGRPIPMPTPNAILSLVLRPEPPCALGFGVIIGVVGEAGDIEDTEDTKDTDYTIKY